MPPPRPRLRPDREAAFDPVRPNGQAFELGVVHRGGVHPLLFHGLDVPRFGLKLKRYGDDLTLLHPDTQLTESAEFSARDVSRSTILVVDDVLYQGHSLARMQTYLVSRGVPLIRAAVLADRCCAVLPVKADIVGVHLQVAPSDVVECNVPPYEETFKIEVLRPEVPGRH